MNKSELLNLLQEKYQQWEAFLDQIGPERLDQPGVNDDWSMKDIIAHLTGWNRWLVSRLAAAGRGEPEPLPPWPAHVQAEDDINAWIYETNHGKSVREVLDETDQVFKELFAVIEGLPEDTRLEQLHQGERVFQLVWLGDERFPVGEFFDHYYDDHEPDVQAWLARQDNSISNP